MSFENLFNIRPNGVVSKKDIGDRKTFLSIPVCKVREAKIPAIARVKEAMRTNKACEIPTPAYTPR